MKRRLLTLILSVVLANVLFIGGGTYALLTASATNSGNQFSMLQAQKNTIELAGTTDTTNINLPMFYDYTISGPNPYDIKTPYIPSGELPGEWSPGDTVRRTWTINNANAASKISEIYSPADNFSLKDANGNLISSGSQAYQDFLHHMKINVYYPQDSSIPVFTGSFQQLLQAPQPFDTVICISQHTTQTLAFVASMDLDAGNDLQGVKGILDFQLGAEQVQNNCFDPPFSNKDYSMQLGSTTPIKFECYDSDGNLIKSSQKVKLVITGGNLGQGITYLLGSNPYPLTFNGGHYQASVYADENVFQDGMTYTATVYIESEIYGQKTFTTEPGNRSNA